MCWKKLTKPFFSCARPPSPIHRILFFLQIHVLSLSPLWCNFIEWDWLKRFIHFLRCPWQKRLQNGLNLRTLTLLYAGRPVLNLDFCELELWPDADQNHHSILFSCCPSLTYSILFKYIRIIILKNELETNLELSSIGWVSYGLSIITSKFREIISEIKH